MMSGSQSSNCPKPVPEKPPLYRETNKNGSLRITLCTANLETVFLKPRFHVTKPRFHLHSTLPRAALAAGIPQHLHVKKLSSEFGF